jgi:hypothetical protein
LLKISGVIKFLVVRAVLEVDVSFRSPKREEQEQIKW